MKKEIVVRGGGVGGLTAAFKLAQTGCRVVVLEKETEIGGLCRSFEKDGIICDLGPHLLWNQHRQTYRLIKELGLESRMFRPHLRHGLYLDGRFSSYKRLPDLLRLTPRGIKALKPVLEKRFSGEKAPGMKIIQLFRTFLLRGADVYLKGGIQTLPLELASAVRKLGGEIHLNSRENPPEALDCTPQGPHLHLAIFYFGLKQRPGPEWFDVIFPEPRFWFQRIYSPSSLSAKTPSRNGAEWVLAADRYLSEIPEDITSMQASCLQSLEEVFPGFSDLVIWNEGRIVPNAYPLNPPKGLPFAGIESAVRKAEQAVSRFLATEK